MRRVSFFDFFTVANHISAGTGGRESEAVFEVVQSQIEWRGNRPDLDGKQNKKNSILIPCARKLN